MTSIVGDITETIRCLGLRDSNLNARGYGYPSYIIAQQRKNEENLEK
jgi:hypothetical protein